MSPSQPRQGYSPGLPLFLTIAVLLALLGSDLYSRLQQRTALREDIALQKEPLAESMQVRQQFEGLISGIGQLAASGNQVAQQVQDELQRRGFNLASRPDSEG